MHCAKGDKSNPERTKDCVISTCMWNLKKPKLKKQRYLSKREFPGGRGRVLCFVAVTQVQSVGELIS